MSGSAQSSPARIHLCYSEKHFLPGRAIPEAEWYSCSQLARHLWRALNERYPGVTYGDEVPDEPLDLLWTNRLHVWKPRVARMATFASVAHYAYVTRRVREAEKNRACRPTEGLYSREDQWKQWLALARSDLVLAIGNNRIRESFSVQDSCGELHVIDCGIDTAHFDSTAGVARGPVFVHNATRFSVRKGSHLVAEAWPEVARRMPEAKLVLLGREGDVDLPGMLKGMGGVVPVGMYESGSAAYRGYLTSARWAVLPSLAEGQAGTLLEAMSCGCVPIASRDTGVDAESYGGYVLEPNTAGALAETMLKAAHEWTPEQSQRVRRETVSRHDWGRFESNVVELTESLLQKPAKRPRRAERILVGFLLQQVREAIGVGS